jgi:ATP-binding cassette subfamily C protein
LTSSGSAAEILSLLEGHVQPVDSTAAPHLLLESPATLWLVMSGTLELFAVSEEDGDWQFLGRLGAGTVLLGSVPGPAHGLYGRPGDGCRIGRLKTAELARIQQEEWAADRPSGGCAPEEEAFARGIEHGLDVLLDAIRVESSSHRDPAPLAPGGTVTLRAGKTAQSAGGIIWVEVVQGGIHLGGEGSFGGCHAGDFVAAGEQDTIWCQSGAVVRARTSAAMLAEGLLLEELAEYVARVQYAFDHFASVRERSVHARAVAGAAAADAARDAADRMLRNAIMTVASGRKATGLHAGQRRERAERAGSAAKMWTRPVRLTGRWWIRDLGPLIAYWRRRRAPVALVWRRGRYDMVDPATDRCVPVTRTRARELAPMALMRYPSLPDGPVSGRQLLRFGMRGHGRDLLRFAVASLATAGLGLLVPIAVGTVLGVLVPQGQRGLIVVMCVAVALAAVVSTVLSTIRNLTLLRIEGRGESTVQAAVWARLLSHPTTFFARHSTGELASAALGVSQIRQTVSAAALVAAESTLLATVNLGLLLWYSWSIAALAAGLALVNGVVVVVAGLRTLAWQRKATDLGYKLANTVFHTIRALPKLRVAAVENIAFVHWARDFARSRKVAWRLYRIQSLMAVFNSAYPQVCALALFLLFTRRALGTSSVAVFLTCFSAFGILIGAVTRFAGAIVSAGAVVPTYEKLRPLLRQVPEVPASREPPGELTGEITVDRVSFRYGDDGPPVLNEVSVHIGRGDFVAIVGPTGCGKSTLIRLMIGFEEPWAGAVRYDGRNLSSLDVAAVRRQLGVVLQHAQPFAGSILSNICGGEDVSVDEAWDAAAMAGLADDIANLPMGMHTVLSDNINTLSGGQRQRLLIARALVRRPRILLLDEATSALDNKTQRTVADCLRTLDATRVVIAHRLSTVMGADKVVVLSDGRVAQQGTPAQLLADTDGLFHRLVRAQLTGP